MNKVTQENDIPLCDKLNHCWKIKKLASSFFTLSTNSQYYIIRNYYAIIFFYLLILNSWTRWHIFINIFVKFKDKLMMMKEKTVSNISVPKIWFWELPITLFRVEFMQMSIPSVISHISFFCQESIHMINVDVRNHNSTKKIIKHKWN